ncbi:nucleotide-binding universal stress UspA family protein [Actinoplanes tereljensis]|uniref:Universal stress protein n=1 Tax=Paractinoplanes tereljensis TaxID=571912 RepID=A0A919NQS5_9ACTN|nr:universal stress protein [Actinoplanes tereljensis]GIF23394.1 universal stress protein [Actinoplanes tereljensis]
MNARKIIVGYDRSAPAKAAARWALDEAARTGALVEFFFAYEWPAWAPATATGAAPAVQPAGEIDRAIRGMLDEAVINARHSHPSVRTTVSIVNDGAAATLIDRSREASLVVLGSHGHSAVIGLLGSVSVAVSASAHCPVVVVRGEPADGAPVVVGVDGSASGQAALAFATGEAVARHVSLQVVRAWAPVIDPRIGAPEVGDAEMHSFDELVTEWRQKHPGLEITADGLLQHPAAALTERSADAQLLVVGTRGRGPVRGLLLGSVSQHLLRHATCTVAVVHDTHG